MLPSDNQARPMHASDAVAIAASSDATPPEAAPIGLRLLAFAREQLRMAEGHLARDGEDRHLGIHQARKCIRRSRATLALGSRAFEADAERLDDDLGRLCRGLSALRDAQALVEVLERLESTASPQARVVLSSAGKAARKRRDQLLDTALRRDSGLLSRQRRLQLAQERLAQLDWNALDERRVVKAVKRSKRRARKAGRLAERHPELEDAWHLYRRRLRRLHQQHSLLATLQPGLLPPTMGLEAHAGALGELQDDALLLRRCGQHSPFPAELRPFLRRMARERLGKARRG